MQRKILLVDDEASLRRTMALGLSQYGYDTEPCEYVATAVTLRLSLFKTSFPFGYVHHQA